MFEYKGAQSRNRGLRLNQALRARLVAKSTTRSDFSTTGTADSRTDTAVCAATGTAAAPAATAR